MGKRLKDYLAYMEQACASTKDATEAGQLREELLVQIAFFQHERLIHLIVTVLFAVLTVAAFFATMVLLNPAIYVLLALFFLLLIPYIRHYYLLENGVQKLYEYYDRIAAIAGRTVQQGHDTKEV